LHRTPLKSSSNAAAKQSPQSSEPLPTPPDDLVVMGQVIAPFGIKGWLRIRTFTDELDALASFPQWWLKLASGWKKFELGDSEIGNKGMTAQLTGIADRTQAEALRNAQIAVSRTQLPQLADDEFYWNDLIGFAVETLQHSKLGNLDGLLETSVQNVLVVKGNTEHLIPAALIKEVDISTKRIIVDWNLDF
jgi:16S rRNA processing protein RimM